MSPWFDAEHGGISNVAIREPLHPTCPAPSHPFTTRTSGRSRNSSVSPWVDVERTGWCPTTTCDAITREGDGQKRWRHLSIWGSMGVERMGDPHG